MPEDIRIIVFLLESCREKNKRINALEEALAEAEKKLADLKPANQ